MTNAEILSALEPFASLARVLDGLPSIKRLADDHPLRDLMPGLWPTMGDCRRANEVWLAMGGEKE